jgi:rhodanese-related sulfurtransferase
MFETIKRLFGGSGGPDLNELIKKWAKIIDVRTRSEYAAGHVDGSINIPLNELYSIRERFSTDTVIITCCASGIRSASAMNVIKGMGFSKVYNGGGWLSVNKKLATA